MFSGGFLFIAPFADAFAPFADAFGGNARSSAFFGFVSCAAGSDLQISSHLQDLTSPFELLHLYFF